MLISTLRLIFWKRDCHQTVGSGLVFIVSARNLPGSTSAGPRRKKHGLRRNKNAKGGTMKLFMIVAVCKLLAGCEPALAASTNTLRLACGSMQTYIETDDAIIVNVNRMDKYFSLPKSSLWEVEEMSFKSEDFCVGTEKQRRAALWLKYKKIPYEIEWIGCVETRPRYSELMAKITIYEKVDETCVEIGLRKDGAVVWRRRRE